MNIEDIKADREAGTPGPWLVEREGGTWLRTSDHKDAYIAMSCIRDDPSEKAHDVINARRIARLPELEVAVIAAEKLADAAQAIADDYDVGHWSEYKESALVVALSAYREATS